MSPKPHGFLLAGIMLMSLIAGYVFLQSDDSPEPSLEEHSRVLLREAAHALQSGDHRTALRLYSQLQTSELNDTELRFAAGVVAYDLGLAKDSEVHLREALNRDPHHLQACGLLAYLMMLEGRSWEATPFLREPIRLGDFPLEHLLFLITSRPIANPEQMDRIQLAEPANSVPLIGVARTAIAEGDHSRARTILERVVVATPGQIEAQVWLGELLCRASGQEFLDWHNQLPESADQHPGIWRVRGSWYARNGKHHDAISCLREAIVRDPNDRAAMYLLGQQLNMLGKSDSAIACLTRAELLQELEHIGERIQEIRSLPPGDELLSLMQEAADATERLGRPWEAMGWTSKALGIDNNLEWARESKQRLSPALASQPAWTSTLSSTLIAELSRYELPDFEREDRIPPARPTDGARFSVTFEDAARFLGLEFVYFNGADPDDDEVRITETTGGGVGVIDYDRDQWPDLYFTQGGNWPDEPGQPSYEDTLFRNSGQGRAWNVTEEAGLGDTRFSQGVAAGDLNNDGFEDLYVANLGQNRLYMNNGDGTFTDITAQLAQGRSHWTTSCLLADLDGDSFPDIYDVNYISNEDISRAVCQRGHELGLCGVQAFAAAQDRLYQNLGDGRFEDVTEIAGIVADDGTGLGIVAADFSGSGELNLFIANDGFPNFLFNRNGGIRYSEMATISGLAFDRYGVSQACMGVAAGDADGDALMDLFVTNFAGESCTLYLNRGNNTFDDRSEYAGLRNATLSQLGFGTQFVDGDLDGDLDLVVTNGHVFDMSDRNIPYAMSPQYFQNLGEGKFEEIDSQALGSFFQRQYLGRGMARLDWNRDGREDLAISHMNAPAAILTNTSDSLGSYLSLQLCGTHCSRDAIGTSISIRYSDQSAVRQLTAGDGYQASNQRHIVFGLGEADRVDEMIVQWPSGMTSMLRSLDSNQHILVVEGRTGYIPINTSPISLPSESTQ